MLRWLVLLILFAPNLAAETPSPRQCFETFIAAVLNTGGQDAEARSASLARCFDFDAWAAHRETADGTSLSPAERDDLKKQWSILLCSDEFAARWKQRAVTILDAPAAEGSEATLTISLSTGDRREEKFLVRMKLDAAAAFWRWYVIEPLDQKAGQNPAPAPRTVAQRLAAIEARLAELDQLESAAAKERESLQRQRRALEAELAEEHPAGSELGTPRAVAEALARALAQGDWGAFLLAHAPEVRRLGARQRFEAQAGRGLHWAALQVAMRTEAEALLAIEMRDANGRARVIAVRAMRRDGRWWVAEAP